MDAPGSEEPGDTERSAVRIVLEALRLSFLARQKEQPRSGRAHIWDLEALRGHWPLLPGQHKAELLIEGINLIGWRTRIDKMAILPGRMHQRGDRDSLVAHRMILQAGSHAPQD
jgi:hypothetical protein